MQTDPIQVKRWPNRFLADDHRVITRLFSAGGRVRAKSIVEQVAAMSDENVARALAGVRADFAHRHKRIDEIWQSHFDQVVRDLDEINPDIPVERRWLIGAYFTQEYSFEAAALFNPSIIPHLNQKNLPSGAIRFIMSLRATGEGHVSSIVFRTGIIYADGTILFEVASPFARGLKPLEDARFDRQTFFHQIIEVGAYTPQVDDILDRLPASFTFADLENAVIAARQASAVPQSLTEVAEQVLWLARSNYTLDFPPDSDPSEAVIFPMSENERRGIEDMRLVRFTEDDGTYTFYGTYTAYNGFQILPQLMATKRFERIEVTMMHGRYARNKGHALFPRKIKNWYIMSSRVDGENLFIMRSKNIRFWNDAEMIRIPRQPWEFVQIGNCGSPIETDRGWLLLTHGVGPMRRYCIGALLLDLDDPCRVIGRLKDPLIEPNEDERDGYVPNVVYSCGAMIQGDRLIIPYAMSDSATSFATVSVSELLSHMVAC